LEILQIFQSNEVTYALKIVTVPASVGSHQKALVKWKLTIIISEHQLLNNFVEIRS